MVELGFPLLARPPALGLDMAEFCFCESRLSTTLCGSNTRGPIEVNLTSDLSDVVKGTDSVLV